jgi:hypothetical protein
VLRVFWNFTASEFCFFRAPLAQPIFFLCAHLEYYRVLRVKIMDNDPLKDDKLGYCKFELDKMDLTSELQPFEKVVDHNIFVKDGKVHLKLAYED